VLTALDVLEWHSTKGGQFLYNFVSFLVLRNALEED
jgi:hypothetical protein